VWGCKYIRELTKGVTDANAFDSVVDINGIETTFILIFQGV